jgi:hypothetical protein
MLVLDETVIHVAEILAAHFIEKNIIGKIWGFIFPETTYKNLIIQCIHETINDFEKNKQSKDDITYPFYHSKVLFEHLSQYILFKSGSLNPLIEEFKLNPLIEVPTENDLDVFYSLFMKKIEEKPQLKVKFINENYKNEIFNISQALNVIVLKLNSMHEDIKTTKSMVEELKTKKSNDDDNPTLQLARFKSSLRDWLVALEYSIGSLQKDETDSFYFTITITEWRKTIDVLIYGLIRPIGVKEIEIVETLKTSYDCAEAWIVSTSFPSPAALEKTDNNKKGDVLCYNFDELIEVTIDFSKYFEWVEKEVKEKMIAERYISLAAKKGEFDLNTKKVVASSVYNQENGWLEGYIDSWLADNQKEHISILGWRIS